MEGKPRKDGILDKTSQLFDLPADVLTGIPRIELLGDRELRIERHKGILLYGKEEIRVSGGKMVMVIRGSGLELKAMSTVELLITGHIVELEFC
jgi:sporulation protein YqfC